MGEKTFLVDSALESGMETCVPFSLSLIEPEERIRDLCGEDKCGNYGKHYMCPPHIGTMEEIRLRLSRYQDGLLFQRSWELDVSSDYDGVIRTKVEFHRLVLKIEKDALALGFKNAFGLIGGNCGLCEECRAKDNQPCQYPEQARPSLESFAVDVLALLAHLGLDNRFHPHKITWTGCLLL